MFVENRLSRSKYSYNCISSFVLGPSESVATPAVIEVITNGPPRIEKTFIK